MKPDQVHTPRSWRAHPEPVALPLAGQRLQRDVGVGELLWVDPPPATDQVLDGLNDVPDVDVHAGDNALVLHPEGDERAGGRVAANPEYSMPRSYWSEKK